MTGSKNEEFFQGSDKMKQPAKAGHTFLVCCDTGCLARGSRQVALALEEQIALLDADAAVAMLIKRTGCHGFCGGGPLVKVLPEDITYYQVQREDAAELVQTVLPEGRPLQRLLYKNEKGEAVTCRSEHPFYQSQLKLVLADVGEIDPESIDDYIACGGYQALKKALTMTPEAIIGEIEASGLRGRGGAGFPTGRKWRIAAGYDNFPKYVVCNGDEGDPGAFMDRSILEGNPHSVLEGLAIAALALGAEEGFLYIRDEYEMALENVRRAIVAAGEHGFLGDNILGSGKNLCLSVVRGGGAFVCGESTALMASIEGRVGEPRAKYIRSVQRGLWDQPTVLNNVETLANIPWIINRGGDAFARIGAQKSSGTKVFALVGKVKRSGLVEAPLGMTLRRLIYEIGGGLQNERPFKAVQTGGPSGGCIPGSMLDLPLDFDTLSEYGAMMGSGGLIVMDDHDCMVETARYYIKFLAEESCGKCTPCREGLRQLLAILTDICRGRGQEGDIELMERISAMVKKSSLCALGKSAPNPLLTTIEYFREEYNSHIREKRCPAGVCTALTTFSILEKSCIGCGLCQKACPVQAISGQGRESRMIDQTICISCGSCRRVCKFAAIKTQ